MVDRVHPLKFESPESGGVETDYYPTGLDKNEDYVDCRGVTFQNTTSDDDTARIDRDSSNNLVFHDAVAGNFTLSVLSSGGFDINNIIWDVAGGLVYANDENAVTRT